MLEMWTRLEREERDAEEEDDDDDFGDEVRNSSF